MSIVTLQTRIKALIDGIKVASGIAATFAYEPTSVDSTPAVSIVVDDGGNDLYSTSNQTNLTVPFLIRVMVEKTTDDATQTALLLGIVDDILDELRKKSNQTLSGDAHSMQVTGFSPIVSAQKGNTNVYYVDIAVEAKTLKSIL